MMYDTLSMKNIITYKFTGLLTKNESSETTVQSLNKPFPL